MTAGENEVKRKSSKTQSPQSAQGPAGPIAHSLQIAEDIAFQERDWRAERIAWVVMALIVAAAMLGLFSVGPLSATRTVDPYGAMEIEYSRFLRLSAPTKMTLRLRPEAGSASGFALILDEHFIEAFRINSVAPSPARSLAAASGLRLEFASSGEPRAAVTLHLEPIRFGRISPQIALPGGANLRLPMFVYP
jgi:hypothetical protein